MRKPIPARQIKTLNINELHKRILEKYPNILKRLKESEDNETDKDKG